MKKIRWGILGTGFIASKLAEALISLDDCTLAAVASRDAGRAKEFAEKYNIEKYYGSYGELSEDPDIDVVYVAVPHTGHKDATELCLRNRKAVLCEKPFTINSRETEELIRLAKENNVFLMEAMWTKFLPASLQVKKWIKEGRIGKVRHIKANFGFYNEFDPDSRLYNPELGGGALLDLGIYPITYATFLLDSMPERVYSCAEIGRSGVDEQNVVILQFRDGILADLSSAVSAALGRDALIAGEKGIIVVDWFWMATRARLYDNGYNLIEEFHEPFRTNGYEYEAEEVNRCLREGLLESPHVPLEDTLSIMKIMDGIRSSWGLVYPGEQGK
ncbi:MAG: Gfo/Idh/MocA family oxidoreductase [Clostridiales bacterium]|nr:Gfo/Idh/MocA family oxidoreductase [Clostridiales bacterium]